MTSDPLATHKIRWLIYCVGVAQDPSNPFGRNELTLHRDRAVLENESRGGQRRRYLGASTSSLFDTVVEHLRSAGFPLHAGEAIPPGGACSLSAMRSEGELTTGAMLSTTRAPGYAQALALLEAVIHRLSDGKLASKAAVELPPLRRKTAVTVISLDERRNPAAPPYSACALDVLGKASDWARELGHQDETTGAHLLVAIALTAYRYVLDRASLPSLAIGNAADGALPEEGESCEHLEALSGVMARAQRVAAEEGSLETTVRHLLVALAEGPDPVGKILGDAGLTRATRFLCE